MLAAGMDTTANALHLGTWHVLSDQRIYRKLGEELRSAIPDRDAMVGSVMLENLPYLVLLSALALRSMAAGLTSFSRLAW